MRIRIILAVLAVLVIFSASTGGYFYYDSLKDSVNRDAERKTFSQAVALRNQVSFFLAENIKTVKTLAGLDELQQALHHPNQQTLNNANKILDHFQTTLGASVCYLMRSDGTTIASSNRNAPDSFVNHHYAFRPYFKQAIKGPTAIYMAMGVTSGKRGVYYSHPVYVSKITKPIGVAVIKTSVEALENEFSQVYEHIMMLTDYNGIVFLSNHKSLVFKTLWKISDEKIEKITQSRQFGQGPWHWSGFTQKSPDLAVNQSGKEFFFYSLQIDNYPGWAVVYLSDRKQILDNLLKPIEKMPGYLIFSACLFLGILVILLYNEASHDLSQRKKMEQMLQRRDAILGAVNLAAESFLKGFEDTSIPVIMERLGQATQADRAFLYENIRPIKESLRIRLRHGWVVPDSEIQFNDSNAQEVQFQAIGITQWADTLKNGKVVYAHLKDLFPYERKHLHAKGVISIILVPIMVGNEWWGFIEFEDCRSKHRRSGIEIDAIKTAADIFGEAIGHQQVHEALVENETKYRQLFENESDAVMVFDALTLYFEEANLAACYLFGLNRMEFLDLRFNDLLANKDDPDETIQTIIEGNSLNLRNPLYHFKTKEGNIFPGEISTGSFIAQDRKKIIVVVRDITERIKSEKQIRTLTQELIKTLEKERRRISRDLHDHIAQDLSTMKIINETLFDNAPDIPKNILQKVENMSILLDQSITAVRDIAYELRPPGLDQLGLIETLYFYCQDFSDKNNMTVDYKATGMKDSELDSDTRINLYRLVQEALNNTNKHAQANHVTVRIVASFRQIILRIEDNGKGFDVKKRMASAVNEKRMGLGSMKERVSLLNGEMKIQSRPEKGTKIVIKIPYETG